MDELDFVDRDFELRDFVPDAFDFDFDELPFDFDFDEDDFDFVELLFDRVFAPDDFDFVELLFDLVFAPDDFDFDELLLDFDFEPDDFDFDPPDFDLDDDFASPAWARCLLTVRAAISSARSSDRPASRSDSLMSSYCRSRLLLHAF